MAVTNTTEWLVTQGKRLIDDYRDEASALAEHCTTPERREAIAELSAQARRHAWEVGRLAEDLADAAGGLRLPRQRHYEELLAEVRAGEHVEVEA